MKTLTEINTIEIEEIKIKIYGFLYIERLNIFKKDTLPEPAGKFTEKALITLTPLIETYNSLFETSIGILNSSHVQLNDKKCIACQRCTKFCPTHALEKIGVDLVLHENKCIRCGNCIGNCSFLALKAPDTGLGVYIKNIVSNIPYMLPALYQPEDIEKLLIKINSFYTTNKVHEETLSQVVERVGFEILLQHLK